MPPTLTKDQAAGLAKLALKGIQQEFPNHPGHVLNRAEDAEAPRQIHPAFYGCFDWHSAVHSHWMLVRLLRTFPDLDGAKEDRELDVLASVTEAPLLATQSLLFALGEGTFMTGSGVFFTQLVGLSAAQVGLGLTIAKQVAEGHGGRAEPALAPGGGLEVRLVLPGARAVAAPVSGR